MPDEDEVVLVDRKSSYVMGLRKWWALVGRSTLDEGRRDLATLASGGIRFQQGTIEAVDPVHRSATVDGARLEADAVIIALGAQHNVDAVPGLRQYAHNPYDIEVIPALTAALRDFRGGRLGIGIFGVPYTCPPAPYELALLLRENLDQRGVRAEVEVFSPQPMSLPVLGQENCSTVEGLLESRGVGFLASHRAVYDLKLSQSRKAALQAVRGRILYDFTGSACEGYTTQVRQVTEMESGERGPSLSDLRSSMWEDDAGKTFRFASTNYVNQQRTQEVDGTATRGSDGIEVVLKKPVAKTFRLAPATAFPTDHLRRVIVAARAGQKVFQLPVYDGSEDGEKIYNTLTVIGDPLTRKPSDAAGGKPELANATRWHVRVSYFDQRGAGEQTPVYAIAFELYDNGISRALTLDYNEFEITGAMSSLEIREAPKCK